MALSPRRQTRFAASIWPGFVDAMTALVLVLFFVLSIFMIVQFVLRDAISGKDRQLDALSSELSDVSDALGFEQRRSAENEEVIATLSARTAEDADRIASFEEQVASLIARNTGLAESLESEQAARAAVEADREAVVAERDAVAAERDTARAERRAALEANAMLELALATARTEIDEKAEAARLAAARRQAMEALVESLREDVASLEETAEARAEALSEAEQQRLLDAEAAEALRARLAEADTELTALTLNLEEERRRAEETLTLLAAADAAKEDLSDAAETALGEAEARAAELAQARALLAEQEDISLEAQKQTALLNAQAAELRREIGNLQSLLADAEASEVSGQVQIGDLRDKLNSALAEIAVQEREKAQLLEELNTALSSEARELARYRSEFFGRMRDILGAREGVRVVGDRFVFDSEVLFPLGSAVLGSEGRAQIAQVADVIKDVSGDIPEGIDWILRVDGHTDDIPVGPNRRYRNNWELSQARALSVVRYLIDEQGIPADHLAATGFGEFQPVDPRDTDDARARNRRIELKFTER